MRLQNVFISFFIFLRDIIKRNTARFNIGIVMLILILATFYLRKSGYISSENIFSFIEKQRGLTPILFVILYSIMPSLFLPTLPLNIGAGFLWGPLWGSVFSIVGATIGSSIAFLIGRYIAGDYFTRRLNFTPWKWLLKRVDKDGWKVVAFTRVNPVFPTTLLNYLFGVTSISFLEYLWSTSVFLLPPTIIFVAFGSSIREFVLIGNLTAIISGILIAVLAMLILFGLKPLFTKMLYKKG